MDKVVGENEGDALAVDSELGLEVPQKVAKINVEELMGDKVEPLASSEQSSNPRSHRKRKKRQKTGSFRAP